MRILLIGGSGFIGPHVARSLEQQGHDVVVFHRGATPAKNQIAGDRRTLGEHADVLRAAAPDVVVDLILSSGTQARELMRLFRGATKRVVALSSCDVYRACGVLHGSEAGPLEPVPLTESSALRTKLQTTEMAWAERIASAAGWSGRFVTLPAEQMPAHLLMPGNTDQHWTIDTTRIREELGYREPVAQGDAIRRTIEWERANPTESSPHAFDYDAEDAALAGRP